MQLSNCLKHRHDRGFGFLWLSFVSQSAYQDIGLTQDNLIKLIFLLQDNHNKEMASIEATDADFAIKYRDRIKATIKALRILSKIS